jgi:hypothetical protein
MIVRPWAEFDADFPKDGTEDERSDFLLWPGQEAAEAIAGILRSLGYDCDQPEHAHEHGWEFGIKGSAVQCQLTLADRWVFLCEAARMFGPTRADQQLHLEVLLRLSVALSQDPRFSELRWFTGAEHLSEFEGALTPLGEK